MSQVTMFDLTVPATDFASAEMVSFLKGWAKKWTFQKEEGGTTGYLHYQVRLSLIVKRRIQEIIASTKDLLPRGTHWSITCNKVHTGQSFNYVLKADTRVEGPWTDQDYEDPPPLTRQLKNFAEQQLYPWQTSVIEWCKEYDERSIKLVFDPKGNAGKSILAEKLEFDGLAYEIPPFRLMEDIMQCVMSIKPKNAYLIDMPRALKKDKLSEFYSGLECLKNGIAYDKRYNFKKRRQDRPQVIVFTNVLPIISFMSIDRWEIHEMRMDRTLRKMTFLEINDIQQKQDAVEFKERNNKRPRAN